jgi:hypothetical protein
VRARLGGAALLLAVAVVAEAGDAVATTLAAPVERVWTAVERGLAAEGWSIERADRPLGLVVTESRRLQGDAGGLHVRARRVRLRIEVAPADEARATVSVRREILDRERVLWIERDRVPIAAEALDAETLERRVLAAIGRAL